MRKILFALCMLFTVTLSAIAQGIPTHDRDKYNEIMSLERKHWDFSPSWYYYFMHQNYSGAYLKWKWGIIPKVRFKESKSNVKTVGPRREKQVIAQLAKDSIVGLEQKYIEEVYEEEVARTADRNIDLVYPKYSSLFSDLESKIAEGLSFCLLKSKGKMSDTVTRLSDRNEVITSRISYLRKMGPGYELENAKREKGYADCLKDMEMLAKDVSSAVLWAKANY